MPNLGQVILGLCLLAVSSHRVAGQEAAQDDLAVAAEGHLAQSIEHKRPSGDEPSGYAYDYDTPVYPEDFEGNVTDAEVDWATWPDSSEPQDASVIMTTTAFEEVDTNPTTGPASVLASDPATAPASGTSDQASSTGSGSGQGSGATTAATDGGPQLSMSAPTVLSEDQPGTVADLDLINPTDKVDGSNPTSTGAGNPPGTLMHHMTMTSAAATAGSSVNGQLTAGAISTPRSSESLDISSSVLNLAGSSLASGTDDLVPKPSSDTSSSPICGPVSTYLLLASLFLSIAYIL